MKRFKAPFRKGAVLASPSAINGVNGSRLRLKAPELRESAIQADIIQGLRRIPGVIIVLRLNSGAMRGRGGLRSYYTWLSGQPESVSAGAPDVLIIFRGGFCCWIETKSSAGRTGDAQDVYIAALLEGHIPVRVCNSADDAVDWVRRLAGVWVRFYDGVKSVMESVE